MNATLPLPSGPIVSTEWLAQHLNDPNLCLVDIRGKVLPANAPPPRYLPKRDDYDAGHIPGAVFVDWTRDIVDLDDPIPSQIAHAEAFAQAMEKIGVSDDAVVVAYDDYNEIFAGRFSWAMRYYGHKAVYVLDGGFTAWRNEGRPIVVEASTKPAKKAGAKFTAKAQKQLRRVADDILPAQQRGALLIDARPPNQYAGDVSAASRAGHIPGAKNVHYALLIDPETSRLRTKEELKTIFANAGIDISNLPNEIIAYCNGGITANIPLLALRLLGRDDVAIYDGSWNEWGNDPTRPIQTGNKP